jgi:hypothetical protein
MGREYLRIEIPRILIQHSLKAMPIIHSNFKRNDIFVHNIVAIVSFVTIIVGHYGITPLTLPRSCTQHSV